MLETLGRLQGADIPASVLESEVLSSRVSDPGQLLDQLCVEGEIVWVGCGALGTRDGKVALYHRDAFPSLHRHRGGDPPGGAMHEAIRSHLTERGASFFRDLYGACGGGDPTEMLTTLWDLVWAGEVTNDTFAPLRAFLTSSGGGRGGRRAHVPSSFPSHAAGRWSLVSDLMWETPDATRRAAATADQLLRRHGVVTRSTVNAEGVPGGFSGIYPVFTHLEESGRVRRGYFVEGLGGAQFALPGAVDRLRAETNTVVALAATDPANPYGAALDWPPIEDGRVGRIARTQVVLAGGRLVAFVDGRKVRLFDHDPALVHDVAAAIAGAAARMGRASIDTVDGEPVAGVPLGRALTEFGFRHTHKGLRIDAGR
jgi:ATP-dependent Lhr-like helicase